jgi:hypothetical protein
MTASFPSTVKTFTDKVDAVDDVMAADVNSAYVEISAVETELLSFTTIGATAAEVTAGTATDKAVTPKALADAGIVPGGGGTVDNRICDGRLTLESGVPISAADQTAKTTMYFTPYAGNKIALYDGSSTWVVLAFSELSLNISAYTSDKNYDIWAYDNSGAVALDSTVWTNDATRATALALQDDVYVKTGATTRRYLGTIRITGTTGECEDSLKSRYVWNYYNRKNRKISGTFLSNSHTYATASNRGWNNDTTIGSARCSFVCGVSEDVVSNNSWFRMTSTNSAQSGTVGVGVNEVAMTALGVLFKFAATGHSNDAFVTFDGSPVAGYNYLQLMEYGDAASLTYTYAQLLAKFWM